MSLKNETVYRAQRIIVPGSLTEDKAVILEGEPLAALLAREPYRGEIITLTDASGKELRGRITELEQDRAAIYLFEELRESTEPPFELFLFQALPDRERMELVIQKATELGAAVIVPFRSRHSISLEEREIRQPKAHRWQHIALKAVKQCRRAAVPTVAPFCSFDEALEIAHPLEVKLLLLEQERTHLSSLLRNISPPRSIALMVGPEGGWDAQEVQQTRKAGFAIAGLGGRILRTETAAIAACAVIQYAWGGP